MKTSIVIIVFCFVYAVSYAKDPETGEKERDKFGLTQQEWEICKTLHISREKIKKLLSSGIGLQEYSKQPWMSLGISESKWISLRRKGLMDDDIRGRKTKEEYEHSIVVWSFFIPGYGHYKLKQKGKAFLFAGIAVGSAGLYLFHKKKEDSQDGLKRERPRRIYLALFFMDCLASAADVWRQTRFEKNPELRRFSYYLKPEDSEMGFKFRF